VLFVFRSECTRDDALSGVPAQGFGSSPGSAHFAGAAIDEFRADEDLRRWLVVNDEITVNLMTYACVVTFAEARDAFVLRAVGGRGDPFCQPRPDDSIKARKPRKDRIDLESLRSGVSGS